MDWVHAANRLVLREDLPLTLQGGEPTLHPYFYDFVNSVKKEIRMDLLTNMDFNVDEFIEKVPVQRFTRKAPYAAIRVSYHPGQNSIETLIHKTKKMEAAGFRVGIYAVLVPEKKLERHIRDLTEICHKAGVDFRTKAFLGEWKGTVYGEFKYPGAVLGASTLSCQCKTSELLVDPSGNIFRCHADLYSGRGPISNVLEPGFEMDHLDRYYDCTSYGDCNPCDVKVKTDRFQIFGHTSVQMKGLKGPKKESDKLLVVEYSTTE